MPTTLSLAKPSIFSLFVSGKICCGKMGDSSVDSEQSKELSIEILDYEPRYANDFKKLNYEWLEEYFIVEQYDRIVLENPQKHIIDLGGHLFFASVEDQIVGTCALLKHSDVKYEIAKLGVSSKSRGRNVGRRLVEACIERAQEIKAHTLVLATSKLLDPANKLYASVGFKECDLAEIGPLPYKRETIAMILRL